MKVAEVRNRLKTTSPNAKISIIADNMILISEHIDPLVWDDEEELLYVLKHNEDHREQHMPFKIQVVEYAGIQVMELDTTAVDFMAAAMNVGFSKEVAEAMKTKLTTIKL